MRANVVVALAILSATAPAYAQTPACRTISDSLERLRCYDAQFGTEGSKAGPKPPPATKSARPEDPLIVKARESVRGILREPASAIFAGLRVTTDAAGNKGVCGTVNSRNALGGMTGPKPFVFNGKFPRVLISADGVENGTSMDNILIGVTVAEALQWHQQFCKD